MSSRLVAFGRPGSFVQEEFTTIAPRLKQFLDQQHAVYELVEHPRTQSAMQSAAAAHVPPSCMAKAVLLDSADDHILAVLSADRRIDLKDLRTELDEKLLLAQEDEINQLFDDCAPGAVPVGFGYDVVMIVDDDLMREPDIFFEADDHRSLVHMEQAEFGRLTERAWHGSFVTPSR